MTDFYLQFLVTTSDFILAAKYLLSSFTLTKKVPLKTVFISLTIFFGISFTIILSYAIYIGIIGQEKIGQYNTRE